MMNSTTQSSFVRSNGAGSGTMHSSGKDLLAKQVQLPQISKQDSRKTFNRIRSEQRQAVNRHYANFTQNNNGNSAKRKNQSSQPKVLTIGQVLLEQQQQKRTPQLPTITPQGNLSGQLSRNKQLSNQLVDHSSQHIDMRKKNSSSGLQQTSMMNRVIRDAPRDANQPGQSRQQNSGANKPQRQNPASRPARVYTAKLTSGTMKNFFFNNQQQAHHQPNPQQQIYAASPSMQLEREKLQHHQLAQKSNHALGVSTATNHRSGLVQQLSSKKLNRGDKQGVSGAGTINQHQQQNRPHQLVVISSQPEVVNASASLEIPAEMEAKRSVPASHLKARGSRHRHMIDSPHKSASNSRQPSASGQTQMTRASMLKIQQVVLNDESRQPQSLDEALESTTQKRPSRQHHHRQEYAIHYSSSQTQLQQLSNGQDFLFEPDQSIEHMNDPGGSGHAAGSNYVQVRNIQANTGNPRRALYSAKQVSQVYRPQPIQQLSAKQHILSANKKKQSMQVVKQSAGNHFKLMQHTQQQFFSKKQVPMGAQVAQTGVRHQGSQRPSQPIASTNINSAPKTSTAGNKHGNAQFKKRTFVNQTASEIFVNHPTTSGSFNTGNQTPSNSAAFNPNGIRTSQAKAPARIGKDEVVQSQQNSSMVQLTQGSPKQATNRQRPVNTAVSTTMTPDLSQKFILFKEHRKRASINNANEHTPAAKTSSTALPEDQLQHVAKNNIMSNRVHSTLAHYNNQLNFDQPTASQSPQAACGEHHHNMATTQTTTTSDLNQMLLSNLIQRGGANGSGGFSRDHQALYEQSRSTSQMQYKTKPEHINPSSQLGIAFRAVDRHESSNEREASPAFSAAALQRSETHDNRRKTGRKFIVQPSSGQTNLHDGRPQKAANIGGKRQTQPQEEIRNEALTVTAQGSQNLTGAQTREQFQDRAAATKYAIQQKHAQQQQSDMQQIIKKRLVYSSYLRKSTQQETVAAKYYQQNQANGANGNNHYQQQAQQHYPAQQSKNTNNKSHVRQNIRKR